MIKLDDRDIAILRILATDGRITKAALAEKVGLTPTPCWDRLKKLEKAGLIDGYGARFNLRKLGPWVTVFVVVELADHTAASFRTFEARIEAHDDITHCWALGGGYDYLMQVAARDVESYQMTMDDLLAARIGIARYFTYIVTKQIKGGGLPPLHLFAD